MFTALFTGQFFISTPIIQAELLEHYLKIDLEEAKAPQGLKDLWVAIISIIPFLHNLYPSELNDVPELLYQSQQLKISDIDLGIAFIELLSKLQRTLSIFAGT